MCLQLACDGRHHGLQPRAVIEYSDGIHLRGPRPARARRMRVKGCVNFADDPGASRIIGSAGMSVSSRVTEKEIG